MNNLGCNLFPIPLLVYYLLLAHLNKEGDTIAENNVRIEVGPVFFVYTVKPSSAENKEMKTSNKCKKAMV